jgi:hypothetical protein
MAKRENGFFDKWEFWLRVMTIIQFLVVVGVGTYLTVAQMRCSQNNLYADTMFKFDDKLSNGINYKITIAIEDKKPLLKEHGGSFNEDDLQGFLGVYDQLYDVYKMGLINKKLIYEDFSHDLLLANNNQEIRKYLIEVRKEGADFYRGLNKLAELFKD